MTRERLPCTRPGVTHAFTIRCISTGSVHRGYVTISTYPDGRVGEIFAAMGIRGSTEAGFLDAWSCAMSMLLQEGVPASRLLQKFRGGIFPPSGYVEEYPGLFARSPIDYICRWIEGYMVCEGLRALMRIAALGDDDGR